MSFLLFLVVLIIPVSSFAHDKSKAELYFLQGKWDKAIQEYEAITMKEPAFDDLMKLADSYLYNNEIGSAKNAFEKTFNISISPDAEISVAMADAILDEEKINDLLLLFDRYGGNPRLWRAAGIALMHSTDDERSLYYFYEAVERDPEDYLSYFYIGQIYEVHYNFDEAIKAYKSSVKINPNYAMALNNLGYAYKERHYYTYAIDMYKKAIAVAPERAGTYYNIGNAYTHKNMIKEAFDSYKKAIELEPTFAKAHYNMGQTYLRMDMPEDALRELKLYVEYWDNDVSLEDAPHPKAVEMMIEEIERIMKGEPDKKVMEVD